MQTKIHAKEFDDDDCGLGVSVSERLGVKRIVCRVVTFDQHDGARVPVTMRLTPSEARALANSLLRHAVDAS